MVVYLQYDNTTTGRFPRIFRERKQWIIKAFITDWRTQQAKLTAITKSRLPEW